MEHNPTVALFLALGLIIFASRAGGGLARMLGQPRVLGELVIGVILGPTLLNMLDWEIFHGADLARTIDELAEIGVLLLMFIVGLEVKPRELREVGRVSVFAGVLGVLAPVALTYPVALLFNIPSQQALFAGIIFAATSVSISAQVLLELGVLRTKEGNALLATAVIDDILAIVVVSLAIALAGGTAAGAAASGGLAEVFGVVLRMGLYMVGGVLAAWFVVPPIFEWISRRPVLSQSTGIAAFGFITMLLFAWSAEEFGGVATITGAFIAGLGISRVNAHARREVEEAASFTAYAFLVPIFFVDVGLRTDLSQFTLDTLPFTLALLAVAVLTKVVGCGGGALLGGFNRQEATRLGVCMVSRGEVGLIIASLGVNNGILTANSPLFIAVFATIVLTTLVTPILVRQVFKSERTSPAVTTGSAGSPAHH